MPVDYDVFGFCTMPCGQMMYRLATGPLPGSLEAAAAAFPSDFLHTGRRHQDLQLPARKRHSIAFPTRNKHWNV